MSESPTSDHDQMQREADVVARHLPEGYSAGIDAINDNDHPSSSAPQLFQPNGESSLKLLGGDVHRALFKIKDRPKLHQRSATFAHPSPRTPQTFPVPENTISATEQLQPGGFRREFVLQRQDTGLQEFTQITKSFVSFLELFGSFAGEDLAESEEEYAIEDEEAVEEGETRPLLGRRKLSRRVSRVGDAGMVKSFFTLLKAFIGTGILFLPKAFKNGGILFSSITLVAVSVVSCICFRLLLHCRKQVGGGYGDIGEAIAGSKFRTLILGSIFLSQIGFVCAGIIFTAENVDSFLRAVLKGNNPMSTNALIGYQLILLIPLTLIRNISKLGPAALLADVCILIGLVYIWWFDISTLSTQGFHPSVELFNPSSFTLTIGSAIFTFEGIGLILPIQSSMAEPQKFDRLLYLVMGIITVIFTSVGFLCYATFGENTRVEVISNFPQDNKLVNAVQFLYSLAVLVGTPVQLFPAVRIIETSLFGSRSGKQNIWTKWRKNAFRTVLTIACGLISIVGAKDLDRFVALIGSFACVPLVYIYPPFLHLRGVADSRASKAFDLALMAVGMVAMVYTTCITIFQWFKA
ncbi:hypothetical protein P152DRAFT_160540 [Eremomyces bilateralis CBS 781.70]|uniref:Amino acid transporter transmembrane domain-containing protein n=1 Tax=Eremomyces bilateralis CBS 781.70 TaxID=1392243 RepID=A0A6G1FUF8_9PEZI|nr:uncharacterized protein P152DRAFT_160540 [Eremomyces bilateralis CBS 781.70]KAF1809322.1 hypothetical protein P152DRAFT_160540 [Eremomyces bilateralis CBS 781.70]